MRTIILAAGLGSRLRDICGDRPKPLFEMRGKSLLEHSLHSLAQTGIRESTIVIGYNGEMIQKKIGQEFEGVKIDYADNPDYATTGSMHSVYCALKLKKPEDCLILDGDLVFNPRLTTQLREDYRKDLALLVNCCGNGDETFTILDNDGKISYMKLNKKVDITSIRTREDVYEFNGISKFSKEFISEMVKFIDGEMRKGANDLYYEECALQVSKKIPWYGLVGDGRMLVEIDIKEDVARAEKVLDRMSS